MKLVRYSLFRPGLTTKQHGIFATENGSVYMPLVYLQRPKWIKNDEVWKEICESVRVELPKNYEVE